MLTGETLRVDDVGVWAKGEEAARSYGVLADGRLVRSWLAAPVRGRGDTVLGVVYLGHHRAHAFDARHERLVAGLCSQLGGALEHCALFAERSRVASALSESLLPPLLPTIAGLDAAARYRPSGADATGRANVVGGDFYDLFEVTDRPLRPPARRRQRRRPRGGRPHRRRPLHRPGGGRGGRGAPRRADPPERGAPPARVGPVPDRRLRHPRTQGRRRGARRPLQRGPSPVLRAAGRRIGRGARPGHRHAPRGVPHRRADATTTSSSTRATRWCW